MEVAAAQPCDDFPVPATLPDLSTHYSEYTTRPERRHVDGSDERDGHLATRPTDHDPRDTTTPGDGDPNYDPNLYAPGAGQGPAETPPAPGGGDTGGTDPGNGANGGGVSPSQRAA